MGEGGGVGLRVRELITELILKKVPQNKVSNTADQNTFWRYFRGGGGGGGGLITELILKKVFRNKVLKTADQNTFWRYLFFYASL